MSYDRYDYGVSAGVIIIFLIIFGMLQLARPQNNSKPFPTEQVTVLATVGVLDAKVFSLSVADGIHLYEVQRDGMAFLIVTTPQGVAVAQEK